MKLSEECTLVWRSIPSLNYAYVRLWGPGGREESQGLKKDLISRGILGGPEVGKYGCISIVLQVAISKWMDRKE